MNTGNFLFIKNEFFDKYNTNNQLMTNHETINNRPADRPCCFVFKDEKNPEIIWCVPISSKVDKYRKLYANKIASQKSRGIKNPKCDTICFAEMLGRDKAFLIQNMFPVTQKYISSVYKHNNKPVTIPRKMRNSIIASAKKVIRLVRKGYNLTFTNINAIYNSLVNELNTVKTQPKRNADEVLQVTEGKDATKQTKPSVSKVFETAKSEAKERNTKSERSERTTDGRDDR